MRYNYVYWGGEHNSYVFETDFSVIYEVKFKNSSYLFAHLPEVINQHVFEFVIDVAFNPNQAKTPFDSKIGFTIAHIFNDFFAKNNNAVSIYICESSDKKQELRMKKFNVWFHKFQDSSYLKLDEILIDSKNNRYPISIIIKHTNPHRMTILEAFVNIAKLQNQEK
jgi:Family of unknown function (DUF6169)